MLLRLRPAVLFCLSCLLAACGLVSTAPQTDEPGVTAPPTVEGLLQQAGSGQSEKSHRLRLEAAELALAQGDIETSAHILGQISAEALPVAEQMRLSALSAAIALKQSQPEAALAALEHPGPQHLQELSTAQQLQYQQVWADVLQANGQDLSALRLRLYIAPLLQAEDSGENDKNIWTLAEALSASAEDGGSDTVLQGWLDLARRLKQAGGMLYQQQQAVRDWQQQNPQHPAAQRLPPQLADLLAQQQQKLARVALLLPQQGQLAAVGQALRDGFIAAQLQEFASGGQPPILDVYDSSQIADMDEVYQKAKAAGTTLLIGPLEKPLVRQLALREQLPLPTLALNYADGQRQAPADLFQFGLAAEDEAREVARRAAADGMRRAVVMVPKSEWGERVLDVFHQSWNALGGQLVAVEYLDQPVQINDQVANLLRLLAAPPQAADAQPPEADTPVQNSAAGGDFMFLAATMQQALQIKPTLAYHQAANLPVYATSHLYNGNLSAQQARDLSGIRFCETPWLLVSQDDALRQQVISTWPQAASSLGRLYAMGMDAFHLAGRLSLLKNQPDATLDGQSGRLSLDEYRRVVRELPWAEFSRGQVQPLYSLPNPGAALEPAQP